MDTRAWKRERLAAHPGQRWPQFCRLGLKAFVGLDRKGASIMPKSRYGIGVAKRNLVWTRLSKLVLVMAVILTVPWTAGAQQFLLTWGSSGSGDGQFSFPPDVAVDNRGDVYVADLNN